MVATAGSGGSAQVRGGAAGTGDAGSGAVGESSSGGEGGPDAGGTASEGGRPGTGGDSGYAGAGADLGGQGGAAEDAYRCPLDGTAPPAPALTSVCDPAMSWGDGERLPVAMSGGDQLVLVTPDELSLIWFDSRGSAGSFRLADRSDKDEPFATDRVLDVGNVAALSPDGLRLAAFSEDQSQLVEFVRATRGDAFEAGDDGAFSILNADARELGYRVLDAIIAPDDATLYYNIYSGEELAHPLHVSQRSGNGPWPLGTPLENCELKGFGGALVRHPTGVSADGLTLFYFDTARDVARAGFRRTANGPFMWFTDLGARYQATPNESCDRLYYWGADDMESSLFVATAR